MIHLVVTCVGSKKNGSGCSIVDAAYNTGPGLLQIDNLYSEWKSLLESQLQAKQGVTSAGQMYKGATWKAALHAYAEIDGPKKLWIISCGFGLINNNERICKYAATFKGGKPDSIYQRGRFDKGDAEDLKSRWWEKLITEPPLGTARVHSIHGLVNCCTKDDIVIVAGGADYLGPIKVDLNLIRKPKASLYLIGYKSTGFRLEPSPPEHLSGCVVPYTDGKKYRQFLADKLGKCSLIQVQNKAAHYLIKQIQTQHLTLPVFP